MKRKITVILLAVMMTGCGSAPSDNTQIPHAEAEAACSTNAFQTVSEKVDEEKADEEKTEIVIDTDMVQMTEGPGVKPEFEVQATEKSGEGLASEAEQATEAVREEVTAPEHTCSWDGGSITRPATCGSEGILTYTCTICKKTRTDSIAKTAHGSSVEVPAFGQQEPDCFWGAEYDVKCEICGECIDTIYKEPLGHVRNEGVVTCLPDCSDRGSIKYTCTRCGFEWSEEYGQVQPHTWVDGIRKETDWLNGGTKEVPYQYCSVCGKRQEYVDAEGKEENE